MLAAGADLAYVSAQLGHANPSITLRIYSHWVPGTRRVTTSVLDTASANGGLGEGKGRGGNGYKWLILLVELARIELATS
jgi:hypothetical protein